MGTQFIITYEIDDQFADERFVVDEEYEARYYYNNGCTVTEYHTTITHVPPFVRAKDQIAFRWHDKDPEYIYDAPEPEEEIE